MIKNNILFRSVYVSSASIKTILFLSVCILITSCNNVVTTLATAGDQVMGYIQGESVNTLESSYAAADYLTQQMDSYLTKYDPIYIQPLTLKNADNLTSQFGRQISAQVGERWRQLGYKVVMPDGSGVPHSAYTLGGNYAIERDVLINLKVHRASDNALIAAFDYKLPKDKKIKEQAISEPRIFRSNY